MATWAPRVSMRPSIAMTKMTARWIPAIRRRAHASILEWFHVVEMTSVRRRTERPATAVLMTAARAIVVRVYLERVFRIRVAAMTAVWPVCVNSIPFAARWHGTVIALHAPAERVGCLRARKQMDAWTVVWNAAPVAMGFAPRRRAKTAGTVRKTAGV